MFSVSEFLRQRLHTDNQDLVYAVLGCMQVHYFAKGDLIVKTGDLLDEYLFLGSHGVVRGVYHTEKGKEITECVVFQPGGCIMPSASLFEPSPVDLEATTDVEIIGFPFEKIHALQSQFPEIMRMTIDVLTEAWMTQWEMKRIRYEYDATERYLWFCEKYPGVQNKMYDKHIASFLDMSPVSLCRIQRKLAEQNQTQETDSENSV